MTERSVTHANFTIDRIYDAPPDEVFAAWAAADAKSEWFPAGDGYELDFRVGGKEVNRGGPDGGPVYTYEAVYHDIVENERIVYAYDMYMDDIRISVSLSTIEMTPAAGGTRLLYIENGAFLDGHDTPEQREGGSKQIFDALATALARQRAGA